MSQTLAWSQILILPLDLEVGGATSNGNFHLLYYVLYPSIFGLVAFINPFAMFFYESDDTDSMCSRISWSLFYSLIVAVIWSGLIFISYIWLGVYQVGG